MAKKIAAPKFVPPTEVEVTYDLDRLPSAQHKAGLAGLLLLIENMTERQEVKQLSADRAIPEVTNQTSTTATVRFTAESAQSLFDDLYDAESVEIRSKTKWAGTPEKRIDLNTNAKPDEPKRWFIYDAVQPSGHFLANYTEGEKYRWHKLWRDMIYAVPRNKPTTRQAYKTRAEKNPTKEGSEAWKSLVDREKAKSRGTMATTELAGSLMLAVQAVTAETVPFLDRVEDQILLHFWVLTTRIFVPQIIDEEGKSQFVGYTLAIPEVADLGLFNRAYKRWLGQIDTAAAGYRPRKAVISLPEQGPLELLDNLDRLIVEETLKARPARFLNSVEFFHMVVAGNNVKLRSHGRIPVVEALVERYRNLSKAYFNPILLRGLLLAMLRNRPWFAELKTPLHEREWSFFVHCTEERRRTPGAMVGFAWEVANWFSDRFKEAQKLMAEIVDSPEVVDPIIYDLVGMYVRERACIRSGVKPDDPDWLDKTSPEERRNICSKLFLEIRSRHGDEFVSYFSDTLASVAQRLGRKRYLLVVRALMTIHPAHDGPDRPRTRDDIKMLTMLALSGQSRSIRFKDINPTTPPRRPTNELVRHRAHASRPHGQLPGGKRIEPDRHPENRRWSARISHRLA